MLNAAYGIGRPYRPLLSRIQGVGLNRCFLRTSPVRFVPSVKPFHRTYLLQRRTSYCRRPLGILISTKAGQYNHDLELKMDQDKHDRDENWGAQGSRGANGFLYVLPNAGIPTSIKVGQTERHPAVRVMELSSHTGVPAPFGVRFFIEVRT